MRRVALLALLAGVALGASACGEKSEPTGPTVKLFPVSVAQVGGSPIVLQHAPARVAAVTPPASSVVKALEMGGASGTQVLSAPGIDIGQLKRFRPDLIVASSEAQQSALAHAERVTKAPGYTISQGSIRQADQGIVGVGALLGRPLQARALLRHERKQILGVRRRVANLPRVSVFLDTGFYITVPASSLAGQMLAAAGGRSIAGNNPGVAPFDLGLLRRRNPDYYLATSASGVALKDLRKNPATRRLRAVKARRFGIVPTSDLEAGPLIGTGVETIARLLHPNAFR